MQIRKITKTSRPIFKSNKDLEVGEYVLTPEGKKKIIAIYDQGMSEVYRIYLSNGESFRTNKEHLNTVAFRTKEKKPIWENVTTSWILENKERFQFRFPTDDDIFSFSEEDRKRISNPNYILNLSKEDVFIDDPPLYIERIEKVENENTRCISLDYPEGLYYTGNRIITHNSFTSTLWSLYVTVHLWAMRDPKKFFSLSQATSIVHGLISFTMEKAGQLLLQPFMQILTSSPKFRRVKMEERLTIRQQEYPDEICFTTAGRMGPLQFYNDVHYIMASSPANLLGLNMITAILSEISFFIDKGFSTEYINRIYQDSKRRVRSRFGDKFFSGTVIDSSPNDIELSPIDKYIFSGRAEEDEKNYVVTGSQWEFLPHQFPEWQRTGETFPVFRGDSGKPPQILFDESELKQYEPEELYFVPIDARDLFEEDILKSVKDICGWPGGSSGTLLRNDQAIEDMFVPNLRNTYAYITAPSDKDPQNLIWNEVKNQFFVPFDKGYEFYRSPLEKRFIHVDLAETGDMASIGMVHPEMTKDGTIMYVTDFTLAISPEKGRINIDAIRLFIKDLKTKGNIPIEMVTYDQYQSSASIQFLKNEGFDARLFSVDRDNKVYLTYISYLLSGRIKAGRNIYLKNNLKSLQEVVLSSGRKKVDHTKGKLIYWDGAEWETSQMGKFAKDVSDGQCGAFWNALHQYTGIPRYIWEDETTDVSTTKEYKLITSLEDRYGFQTDELEEALHGRKEEDGRSEGRGTEEDGRTQRQNDFIREVLRRAGKGYS